MPARHMQFVRGMPAHRLLRILWVRSWCESLQPLRDALGDLGYRALFTRTDIEPALHAAISRRDFEIAIVDRECGISRELVEIWFREHRVVAPLLDHQAPATLARRIDQAMLVYRS